MLGVLLIALPIWAASGKLTSEKQLPIRLSIEYGYSHIVNDDPDTLSPFFKDLNSRLRSASNFLLSVSAYLHGNIGLGLFYSRYISHASLNAYAVSVGRKTFSGPYRETISVNYFGPVLGLKSSVLSKNLIFVADLRPGLILFFDDISVADAIFRLSSPVPGLGGALGIEYLFKNNFAVGLSVNGLYASIPRQTDAGGATIKEPRNISRMDINLGVKLHVAPILPP